MKKLSLYTFLIFMDC